VRVDLIHPSAWKGNSPKFALTEFSSVHLQRYAYPWPYTTTVVDLSEPTFGRLRVRTLPRLINTGLVREREEGHVGRERDRQPRGGGQGRRGQGRERHDRERGGSFEDRPGDPSDPSDPGEAMPEHEFRHRIREHLARIDERLERIEERLGRLER
jgi:hypothetical protein